MPVWTPYSALDAVLRRLLDGVRTALDECLLGAYLQGSFAVGDADEHSDVDFIVATTAALSPDQVNGLQSFHAALFDAGPEWARHLEGSYIPCEILRHPGRAGEPVWYLDHGSRNLQPDSHCNTVVVRWILREHGVVLTGPHPRDLIDPIGVADLRAEIIRDIGDWGGEILDRPDRYRNRFYQSFIVLNLARMLHDLGTGTVGSKRTGAEWAKTALGSRWAGLIDRAWAGRPDPARAVREPADESDFALTLDLVREVMARAGRADR